MFTETCGYNLATRSRPGDIEKLKISNQPDGSSHKVIGPGTQTL